MLRTRLNVWVFGLALGLVGGSVAAPKAQAQISPVDPGVKKEIPDEKERPPQKVVVTSPQVKDVVATDHYPCRIHSHRHIKVCALQGGSIETVSVKEGQAVKKGDLLFKVVPTLYQARLDAELAEVELAKIELENTRKLFTRKKVTEGEVALSEAKLKKAQARAKLAEAELSFATVRAPFDGLVGSLEQQEGSLVKEGDVLTTLSDNSVMWVYFNVSEARYLEYMAERGHESESRKIELQLANGKIFPQTGKIGAIEAKFNNETGNIPFRADFPNPDRLLRHGQTGTVLIRRTLKNVTVIPQQATFEVLDRQYVSVVGKDGVVHQREIIVENEVDDIFVIKKGLEVTDKIVLEGGRHLRDGDKVEYVFRKPEESRPKIDREK
jgi:membrane fusion protein (multidrug efflux system)